MKITPGVYEMRNGDKATVRVYNLFSDFCWYGFIGNQMEEDWWTESGESYTSYKNNLIRRIGDLPTK